MLTKTDWLLIAVIVFAGLWALTDSDALTTCQQTQSTATCLHTLQ